MSWSALTVSADRTHHVAGERPAYDDRFDEVLPFHAPGLAPVRRAVEAWHIDEHGRAAYEARFLRTFGFYEGRAAVVSGDGWRHIAPDGRALTTDRYSWCGNFQGGRCTVRRIDDRYLHIDLQGAPVSRTTWRYAGDYREGAAVVQADDGRSSHVDPSGELLHGRWFLDLDVFHKSFARARDDRGWHHVDRTGQALYDRRFAAVEPFYNGQARVERVDGGLEVIDESGATVVELRPGARDLLHTVSAELVSFWRCETIFAAVDLGVFESLPLRDPAPRLLRLLEALGELGLIERRAGTWDATPAGSLLRRNHPRSLAAAARYWAGDGRTPWASLREAITDSGWSPPDPFEHVSRVPAAVAAFHDALRPYAENDYSHIGEVVDLASGVIVDAGGATGALSEALLRARPGLAAVVLDRPEVAALGTVPMDLEGRLSFVAGDVFAPWPISGDAVVLARVLHDWSDAHCVEILRRANAALPRRGKLYVVEMVRGAGGFDAGLLSLHLLVSSGGTERGPDEYESLFADAGFHLREVRSMRSISSVLVAEAT